MFGEERIETKAKVCLATQPYATHFIKTNALLACGLIGCPSFVVAFLIEGATRADYNAFRHPISSLSIGEFGWMQVANFILTGSLLFAFAIGLQRALRNTLRVSIGTRWAPLLLGLVAIGLIGAGIFTTDPVYGYPPDAPLLLAQTSIQGHLHDLFSIFVFIGLPSACFVLRRRFAALGKGRWAMYSTFTGVAMLVTFVLAGLGFKQISGFVAFAGIYQRLSITIGWLWITVLAVYMLRIPTHNSIEGR